MKHCYNASCIIELAKTLCPGLCQIRAILTQMARQAEGATGPIVFVLPAACYAASLAHLVATYGSKQRCAKAVGSLLAAAAGQKQIVLDQRDPLRRVYVVNGRKSRLLGCNPHRVGRHRTALFQCDGGQIIFVTQVGASPGTTAICAASSRMSRGRTPGKAKQALTVVKQMGVQLGKRRSSKRARRKPIRYAPMM